jgi:hypothetical protein
MWLYPGPSCPNCPSSEELSAVERLTPGSLKSWILGLVRTLGLALPLCKMGLPAPRVVCLVLFQWLMRFYLFIALAALHRGLRAAVASHEMSTRLRMWLGGRQKMPSMRKRGLRKRGNRPVTPPIGRRRGRGCTLPWIMVLR